MPVDHLICFVVCPGVPFCHSCIYEQMAKRGEGVLLGDWRLRRAARC
jgi:hypothetical protein